MLAICRAINLPSLTKMHESKVLIRIVSSPKDYDFRSLDSSFFNATRLPIALTGLKKTIETINIIKEVVVIVVFVDLNFQASPQPLQLIQPIF